MADCSKGLSGCRDVLTSFTAHTSGSLSNLRVETGGGELIFGLHQELFTYFELGSSWLYDNWGPDSGTLAECRVTFVPGQQETKEAIPSEPQKVSMSRRQLGCESGSHVGTMSTRQQICSIWSSDLPPPPQSPRDTRILSLVSKEMTGDFVNVGHQKGKAIYVCLSIGTCMCVPMHGFHV